MRLILFYVFAGISVVSALSVISFRNSLSSAMSLVVTLFLLACLYILLDAHFLAAMQILVYAGAIMVFFVFVIMMLNLRNDVLAKTHLSFASVLGILMGGYLSAILTLKLRFLSSPSIEGQELQDYGTIKEVGRLLLTRYLIPFELTSILLLIAIVGAVVMAKEEL